jgi:hypothetical protein
MQIINKRFPEECRLLGYDDPLHNHRCENLKSYKRFPVLDNSLHDTRAISVLKQRFLLFEFIWCLRSLTKATLSSYPLQFHLTVASFHNINY